MVSVPANCGWGWGMFSNRLRPSPAVSSRFAPIPAVSSLKVAIGCPLKQLMDSSHCGQGGDGGGCGRSCSGGCCARLQRGRQPGIAAAAERHTVGCRGWNDWAAIGVATRVVVEAAVRVPVGGDRTRDVVRSHVSMAIGVAAVGSRLCCPGFDRCLCGRSGVCF